MRLRLFRNLISVCLLLALAACTTVPETGRRQLNFIPDSLLVPAAHAQFQAMQQEVGKSRDAAMQQRLERVGRQIVQVAISLSPDAKLPPLEQWQFVVFASDDLNAFAMPGGYIGFYEGIMRLFENDDQLAAVIGHEVGHVVAKHGNERVSQQLGVQIGLMGGAIGLSHTELTPEQQQMLLAAIGLGSQLGILLPYSRSHESEADYFGLLYLTHAGYDPEQAVRFWELMMAKSGPQPPEWLSTHPSSQTRIRQMRQQIPAVRARVRGG